MIVSAGLRARRSRWALAGLALAVGLTATLIVSQGNRAAADASLDCNGKLTRSKENPGALTWRVGCNQTVWAVSVISNKQVVEFDTEGVVYDSDGEVVPAEPSFECNGTLPGSGVGCFSIGAPAVGAASGHFVGGDIHTSRTACRYPGSNRLKVWFVATVDPGAPGATDGLAQITDPVAFKRIKCAKAHH